ncbi:M1 family metallopeptidase [Saccharothrix violaceirubra]|uniref:Aminopeptidase N n=1 Tax=Saccharothrix violaceirubra TaxID=413306 RepID=A0A7W7T969_9PSEU|nr:M1 family metallopeptidase [Saccharothrix violaceirubra]MBB4968864.1 aminopeptidase N [Saccharothrix violaceirubra]
MAVSRKTRPALAVVAVLALVTVGVVVWRIPSSDESRPAAATTTTAAPATGLPGADGAGDPYYPTDGNAGYDVERYDVTVEYDPETKRLDGRTRVTATATADLTGFNLDLYRLTVSEVEVADTAARFRQEGDHELVVTPAAPIPTGTRFTVEVAYGGEPGLFPEKALGSNGWQISASGGAFAAGEPHSATTWFPANDTPRDKASFHLVATVPEGWSVVSNGRLGETTTAAGRTTVRWDAETPMATYLTTIAIDRWRIEKSTANGVEIVHAYAPGAEKRTELGERLPEVLEFLAGKFGPYPFDAAGGIFLSDRIGFSLETQTRPIYAAWADLDTVVHENAHQWFGDSVTVDTWADICLNECFASYASWLWDEAKNGADLDAAYRADVEKRSDKSWKHKLYDMGAGNEFKAVYDKGPLALHALRRYVGDDAFDRILKGWVAKHTGGNASWPEFEKYAAETAGRDLDGFFAAWFRGDGVPADEYLWPGPLRR